MDRGRPKLSLGIGGRTGKNVLLNKNIRKLPDGRDNFEDYFTDSSDGSETTSISYSSVSQTPGVSTRNSKAVNKENIKEVIYSSPSRSKSTHTVIGSRSKKNILPPKNIRKIDNGIDNFEDYFTDGISYENTFSSATPENSDPLPTSQVSPRSKITTEVAPAVGYSSPITRLSSSKAIGNDADNPSGSQSEDSNEEIYPLISNTFTHMSKRSARKSMHKKRDSCDAKILKLAEDYEKSKTMNDNDLQLHATKEAKSSKSVVNKTPQRIAPESPVKKTASDVIPEKNYLTRSRSSKGTPTKSQSECNNLLVEATDINISLKKHSHEQNISKGSDLNISGTEQSHFNVNTAQNNASCKVHPVSEQDSVLYGNKSSTSKFPLVKRKLNLTPDTASKLPLKRKLTLTPNTASKLTLKRKSNLTPNSVKKLPVKIKSNLIPNTASKLPIKIKSNLTPNTAGKLPIKRKSNLTPNTASKLTIKRKSDIMPNTASKKKSNSFVGSSKHSKNMKASKDLPDDDLNVTRVINPQGLLLNNEGNSNDHDSQLNEKEKADSKPSETLQHFQKVNTKSPKKTLSFASPEKHHDLATSQIETSIETQSGNMDRMLIRTASKNIPKEKQVCPQDTFDSSELQRRRSIRNNFDVNTAQDSEDSSEENGVAPQKSTSYRKKNVARKSGLTPITARKKKAYSFVDSAKKHKTANDRKEKISSSARLSDKHLNKTDVQLIKGLPDPILNATFPVIHPVLSLSRNGKTLKETNKNKEEGKNNKQTGKQKKAKKSLKNPEPMIQENGISVSQENEAPAAYRRSGRKRIAPLEAWRNERPRYRIENGLINFIDIDPGNKEDDGAKKAIEAKQYNSKKRTEESKKKPTKPPKVKFKDLILEKKVTLSLLKRFSVIPWEGQADENSPYCIKRVVYTPNSNFGFIEIKVGKSKPMQYLPTEDIYLCLMQGKLKATIGGREILMEEKDTLIVPRSVPYTLINNGQRKALLVFSVGRYKYLENAVSS